jgi:hypothetical protein
MIALLTQGVNPEPVTFPADARAAPIVTALFTQDEARADARIRTLVRRAIDGDLCNWPLDLVGGNLILAGVSTQAAKMLLDCIAGERCRLAELEPEWSRWEEAA